jgi:hypothetical protein
MYSQYWTALVQYWQDVVKTYLCGPGRSCLQLFLVLPVYLRAFFKLLHTYGSCCLFQIVCSLATDRVNVSPRTTTCTGTGVPASGIRVPVPPSNDGTVGNCSQEQYRATLAQREQREQHTEFHDHPHFRCVFTILKRRLRLKLYSSLRRGYHHQSQQHVRLCC